VKRTSITFVRSWATFSPDGVYRYLLGRVWDESLPLIGWCACNPSTDEAAEPDPTNWRIIDFSVRFGYGGYVLGNVYGLRSTDPQGLWGVKDPIGSDNDQHLDEIAATTDGMIVCWGTNPKRDRIYDVTKLLRKSTEGVNLWCLRKTTGKLPQPEHPLYLPAKLERMRWP
jgi:hypothetical protein